MYFTNVIRRAASRVIPSASQRYYHHQSLFSTAAPIAPTQNLSRCSFSTVIQRIHARKRKLVEQPSTTRRESDDALLKVLNSEIHCAQEANENYKIEDVPESFPFIIFDQRGEKRLTLTRHYYGERITVEVHIGQPTTDKEEDTEVENSNDSDYNDESDDVKRVLLICVKVSKNDGPRFLFFVSAYPDDEIEIEHLSISDPDTGKDPYVGPKFGGLDENLKKEFHKYLDNRGINSSSAKILYEYMMKKESNDYEGWLKKAKRMIEA